MAMKRETTVWDAVSTEQNKLKPNFNQRVFMPKPNQNIKIYKEIEINIKKQKAVT